MTKQPRAWRWSWIVAVVGLLGAVAGWAVSSVSDLAESTSSATILVTGELANGQVDSALTSNQYVNQRMSTYAGLATSKIVLAEAARRVGLDPSALEGSASAVNPENTTLLEVSVRAPSPADAQVRAVALAEAVTQRIQLVENPPGVPPRVTLETVSTPSLPSGGGLPSWLLILLGAAAGVVLGITVVATMAARARRLADRRRYYDAAVGSALTNFLPGREPGPGGPNPPGSRSWEPRQRAPGPAHPENRPPQPTGPAPGPQPVREQPRP